MTMLAFERRWAVAALEGFAPEAGPGIAPEPGQADYLAAITRMMERGTRLSAVGLRIALYIATFAPLILSARPRLLASYAPVERSLLLARLLQHPVYVIRELVLLLKVCACLAIFRVPALRDRSRYDGATAGADEEQGETFQSGERLKVRLAVVGASATPRKNEVA